MPQSTLMIVGLCSILCLAVYRFIVQPLFISPLSKIPHAHWSAPISNLWINYHRFRHQNTTIVHAAHERYGPIIRLAPNEISVNCIDGGLRSIYAGGFEKGDWYSNAYNNYGIRPMFCMERHADHSKRKRMLSNIYAKSTLHNSESYAAMSETLLHDRLLSKLGNLAVEGQTVDMFYLFSAVTMDFICAYCFGVNNCSDWINNLELATKTIRGLKTRQQYDVWPQEMPIVTAFLERVGLSSLISPPDSGSMNQDIDEWILDMCDKAEQTVIQLQSEPNKVEQADHPHVYAQLRSSMVKDGLKADKALSEEQIVRSERLEIASELADHIIAGFDTSSTTLTWLAWELSLPKNSSWQRRLHEEVSSVQKPDSRQIDAMPVMHAILMETLRLHTAIPGAQPRVTPAGATLGPPGKEVPGLPANVRVSAQAWSLHRNPDEFPEPESWLPERWLDALDEQQKEMARWFWAFGSGGRMCVGSNLAMLEMKAIIALIWGRFTTSIVFDEGMIHNGGYFAEAIGKDDKFLIIRFEKA